MYAVLEVLYIWELLLNLKVLDLLGHLEVFDIIEIEKKYKRL